MGNIIRKLKTDSYLGIRFSYKDITQTHKDYVIYKQVIWLNNKSFSNVACLIDVHKFERFQYMVILPKQNCIMFQIKSGIQSVLTYDKANQKWFSSQFIRVGFYSENEILSENEVLELLRNHVMNQYIQTDDSVF